MRHSSAATLLPRLVAVDLAAHACRLTVDASGIRIRRIQVAALVGHILLVLLLTPAEEASAGGVSGGGTAADAAGGDALTATYGQADARSADVMGPG